MKTFTMGAIAGASALALAVPLLAQLSSAQSSSSAAVAKTVPTQACIQAMAGLDEAMLAGFDARTAAQKVAMQERSAALTTAASIADDTQRQVAVKKANQDFATAMKAQRDAQSPAVKTAMDAVKTACGNTRGFMGGVLFGGPMGGHKGMPGRGDPSQDMLAAKLGITADQLKTELAAGKTIEQIAQEHGVTLPAKGGHRGWGKTPSTGTTSSQAAAI